MSHFSVMVIGDDIEKQLAPYHEFECTGEDDQYVQEIDITESCRKEFGESTTKMYKDPSGKLHDPHLDRFYREFTPEEKAKVGPLGTGSCAGIFYTSKDWGDGYRAKVHFLPKGWEDVEVPTKDARTFADWLKGWHGIEVTDSPIIETDHKYGYALTVNGEVMKVVKRTNPNKQWDGWTVGGRWSNFLLCKDGDKADQATKADIDIEGMRDAVGEKAAAKWDKAHAIIAGREWTTWDKVRDAVKDIEQARKVYNSQPPVKDASAHRDFTWDGIDEFAIPRAEYVANARQKAISTYAVVKDGKWYSKGKMGWWGVSHGDIDQAEWDAKVSEMLDGLPSDTTITIVDCHI